jgi:hypothetical protein
MELGAEVLQGLGADRGPIAFQSGPARKNLNASKVTGAQRVPGANQ